jgi:hypothetical protein
MELVRPPRLGAFLDYGGDLACFPGLEGLAEAVVVQRRLNTAGENREQAAFCRRCVDTWLVGGTTIFDELPGDFAPTQLVLAAFAWQAECYEDGRTAARFEAALPPGMLAEHLAWAHERRARPQTPRAEG